MIEPALSVVIPVHNGEPFLRHTLQSVLDQEQPPAELIILENASTDDTPRTIAEFLPRFRCRVRLEHNDRLIGPAENFQKSAGFVTSSHFAFLAADDLLAASYVREVMAVLARHPEVDLLFTARGRDIDAMGNDRSGPRADPWRPGFVPRSCFLDRMVGRGACPVVTGIAISKRLFDHLGGWDTRFPCTADHDFYLRAAREAAIYYHPERVTAVRFHAGQGSVDLVQRDRGDAELMFQKLLDGSYDHFSDAQKRGLIDTLCYTRCQYFSYWLRSRGATIGQVRDARRTGLETLRRWRQLPNPLARYVRTSPPSLKGRLAWWLGATDPGIWLLQRVVRKLPRLYEKSQIPSNKLQTIAKSLNPKS